MGVRKTGQTFERVAQNWMGNKAREGFKILSREGYPDFVFAFNDGEEIRVRMFDWIIKQSGPVKDL